MGSPAGNSNLVRSIGPGQIFLGLRSAVTRPVELPDPVTGLYADTDLRSVGFTTTPGSLSLSMDKVDIKVSERSRPIKYKPGAQDATFTAALAEVGPANLQAVIPGAVVTTTTGGSTMVALPKSTVLEEYTLVWVAEDNLVAMVMPCVYITPSGEYSQSAIDSDDVPALEFEASLGDAGPGVPDLYWIFDTTLNDL